MKRNDYDAKHDLLCWEFQHKYIHGDSIPLYLHTLLSNIEHIQHNRSPSSSSLIGNHFPLEIWLRLIHNIIQWKRTDMIAEQQHQQHHHRGKNQAHAN